MVSPNDIELVLYRLDQQDVKLDRIEEQARKTNGRVTSLELWRARAQGAWFVASLAGPILAAVLVKYFG